MNMILGFDVVSSLFVCLLVCGAPKMKSSIIFHII